MKKLAIFDLDGTLLNTLADLTTGTNLALADFGMPPRTQAEVRRFVGNGIALLIHRAVPAGTDPETEGKVLERFKFHYGAHCLDQTAPYAGIPELLQRLRERGIRAAVVSNKADFAVQRIMRHEFPGLVDAALGERPPHRKKPDPDMVEAVLGLLNVPPEEAVYIGDSSVDAQTAANSGLDGILVTWGFRDRKELQTHGLPLAGTPEELEALLLDRKEKDQ